MSPLELESSLIEVTAKTAQSSSAIEGYSPCRLACLARWMAIIEVIAEKKACLENKTPQRSNSTTSPSNPAAPPHPPLHHLTQKGLIGCPGPTTYCFPPMHLVRFNTLIRCDKFNELVSEEEKPDLLLYLRLCA
ncbi:hypothetical protein EYF80_023566 [Liparis tanakae]|uniref:Uncharacterized protein n=1 Tax=Liparis tanakae TaxID=230148 RepID=A0A4Z2HKC4_9TELE|nr:hypothetical protein EYF80_023566 [Liparis tanakae]